MIVDDEALIAFDFEMTLVDAGYDVLGPATSLDEALDMVSDETPRAAVLDIDLNARPVWPLARKLRESGTHIVFVSANLRHEELTTEFKNEPRLDKPVSERDLLKALSQGLAEQAAHCH
nr:response regulator [Qipengyuania intermedia]